MVLKKETTEESCPVVVNEGKLTVAEGDGSSET